MKLSLGVFALAAIVCALSCSAASESIDGEKATDPTPGSDPTPPAPTGTTPTPPSPTVGVPCSGKAGKAGDTTITIASLGGTPPEPPSSGRKLDLHVPKTYAAEKAMPLVLAFPGYLMGPGELAKTTKLAETADARGFLVAFVKGESDSFNGGDCCGKAKDDKLDDVKLARDAVKTIEEQYCVDAKRVFATGFSNGGFLSHRIACEAADVFAAIASVSGVIGVDPDACKPSRPISVLQIHGTADNVVPYKGGRSLVVGPEYRSVATTIASWTKKDGCNAAVETKPASKITAQKYDGCAAGTSVALYTIDGGDHSWPNRTDWAATTTIADFFAAHAMP